MKKILLLLIGSFFLLFNVNASNEDSLEFSEADMKNLTKIISADTSIKYKTGIIHVNSEIKLNVPKGYKFMSQKDAEYVVFELWGNPRTEDLIGMIVKEDYSTLNYDAWAFVVSYENSGYVKDEDANDIDYEELMTEIQSGEEESNKQRKEAGFPAMHIIGWASTPFYDKEHNILHWAKSITFDESEDTTLNYDVRILGRKGILSLNAVGVVSQLEDIKAHIPDIISIAEFKEGNKYQDFNPDYDKVAAYSIGGLIAGKLLAKAGIIALLLKNIKLIVLGAIALFGSFGKKIIGFFRRKKEDEETETPAVIEPETPSESVPETIAEAETPKDPETPSEPESEANDEPKQIQ